jgi:hypothetical protein
MEMARSSATNSVHPGAAALAADSDHPAVEAAAVVLGVVVPMLRKRLRQP